jgi:AcrR family transcriptional regulator
MSTAGRITGVTARGEDRSWDDAPLPRGRHGMDRAVVLASQRERLLRAMEELVGEKGYEATSVPQVVRRARVSSNAFYACFADKADCFVALSEQHSDEVMAALTATFAPRDSVADALADLDRGIMVYLTWWKDRPGIARAHFVELPLAGVRALDLRDATWARFAALHRLIAERARAVFPDAPELRDEDVDASVILSTELVAREVRAGRVAEVDRLAAPLRRLMVKLLVGVEAEAAAAVSAARSSA